MHFQSHKRCFHTHTTTAPLFLYAFPAGLASVTITPAGAAGPLRVEQRGAQALSPDAVRASGAWPTPPAVALQPGAAAAYATAERQPGGATGAWVSILDA